MKLVLIRLFNSSIANPILPASHLSSTMERQNDPDDVGADWDELVSGPDGSEDEDEDDASANGPHPHGNPHAHACSRAPGDDGIEWAPDVQAYVSPPAIPPEDIGPRGEMLNYARESPPLAGAVNGTHAVDPWWRLVMMSTMHGEKSWSVPAPIVLSMEATVCALYRPGSRVF